MKLNITHYFGLMLAFLFVGNLAFGQNTPSDIATQYLSSHHEEWGLTQGDISAPIVSDLYTDRFTGITRVFFQQQHEGIPVYNAIINFSINANGEVFSVGKRFVKSLSEKVNTTLPIISAEQAVQKLATHLGLANGPVRLLEEVSANEFVFDKGTIAQEDIKVFLSFQPVGNDVRLVWDVTLFPVASSDMWSIRVDAVTGAIAHEHNWTVYCDIGTDTYRHDDCVAAPSHQAAGAPPAVAGETYNVWPIPFESPNHGPRTIVVEPHSTLASPFAWHDTDGVDGAEFTITRGNNVHAYEDSGAIDGSSDNEPDGGADLIFDFPFNEDWEPAQYQEAATTQLFYMNNIMHDFAYHYGMTEGAGAFQDNNYGNGGNGNDHVNAEAQDGSGTNNANFGTPPDGGNGRMQMFLWGSGGNRFLNVESPASIAGPYETGLPVTAWGAGASPSTTPVTAEVVIVEDGVEEPFASDGCETITNGGELAGKIALIDRGGCEFGFKALSAQNEGAVGVIICNFEDATINMNGGQVGDQVEIPTVFISSVSCQTIRQFVGNGLEVSLVDPGQNGPSQLDGDLDNGIVSHEYGHGISNRLTGGPNNTGCLGNGEQMGEGWSDFMTLIMTVKDGDDGPMKRGVGTYATSEVVGGTGIREFAYSTDMDINPHTYADVATQGGEVHGIGSIWCAMLWEVYWSFVEEYGWSDDIFTGTAGNNMAIRLVFEGMKNQPCSPGFVDGRDAILQADMELYGGANQCLIWKAFAKRGCGLSADQGTPEPGDETEAFDIPCTCADEVGITKSVTPFIEAGDDVEVTLDVSNCHTTGVTGVTVTDEIPDGLTFVDGSSNVPATVSGNTISFDLGDMASEEVQTITFTLSSDEEHFSTRIFLDDVPDDNEEFWVSSIIFQGNSFFGATDAFGGLDGPDDYLFYVEGSEVELRAELKLDADEVAWDINVDRPTLRFYHRYNTEPGADGGVVDVRAVGTTTWKQVQDNMLRNGYPAGIQYGTFIVPNLQAFSGFSGDELEATYVDLSDFAGQTVEMRFRFGLDDNTSPADAGWWIDNIEYMDLFSYNGQACVTTTEGDNACAIAPEEGTIVESEISSGATVRTLEDVTVTTFPNPANDLLNIHLNSERQMDLTISLINVDGREIMSRTTTANGNQQISLDVKNVPAGFYFLRVSTDEGVLTNKVIID